MSTQDYFPDVDEPDYKYIAELVEPLGDVGQSLFEAVTPFESLSLPLEDLRFGSQYEPSSFHSICVAFARSYVLRIDPGSVDWTSSNDPLLQALVELTSSLAMRPLVDDMNSWDSASEGSESAYIAYCTELASEPRRFLSRYPVMSRRLHVALSGRIAAMAELRERWRQHRDVVATELGIESDTQVVGATIDGDSHNDGRSVAILRLAGGGCVVYKPRTVDAEFAYYQLTRALNRELGLSLQAPRVSRFDGFGFVEFVDGDQDGVDPRALGELLAVLYLLRGRDFHFENLLSKAGLPVAVDLETLLHPDRLQTRGLREVEGNAYQWLDSSAYGTGILPLLIAGKDSTGYIDVSAIGQGVIHGLDPFKQYAVEPAFNSQARIRLSYPTAAEIKTGKEFDDERLIDFTEGLLAGFTTAYRRVSTRIELFASEVHKYFAGCSLRYIHNATSSYGTLLNIIAGPKPSADLAAYSGLAARIAMLGKDAGAAIVQSEFRQMWSNSVPYFTVSSDELDIREPSGSAVGSLSSTPLQLFDRRIRGVGEADLEEQLRVIEIAMRSKVPDDHHAPVLAPQGRRSSGATGLADALDANANWLLQRQLPDRYDHLPACWVGPIISADTGAPWPPGIVGYDLYSGRVGAALALLAAGVALGSERYVRGGMAVFDPVAAMLLGDLDQLVNAQYRGQGLYSGLSSTIWGVDLAGRILGDDRLRQAASNGLSLLKDTTDAAVPWSDLMSGDVGGLLVQVELESEGLTHIDAYRVSAMLDASLNTLLASEQDDLSLAHGLAGLRLAVRKLEPWITPTVHERVCREAERLILRPQEGATVTSGISWCNGLSGQIVAFMDDVAVVADLVDSARLVAESGPLASLTLCHGVLGLFEVLRVGSQTSGSEACSVLLENLARRLDPPTLMEVAGAEQRSRYSHSPSLMAGVGSVTWHLATRLRDYGPLSMLAP